MKIAQDKWRHFYVGAALGFFLQLVAVALLPFSTLIATAIVFFLVVAASYGFELLSLVIRRGHYDIMDAVAGVIGGALGMGVVLIGDLFI